MKIGQARCPHCGYKTSTGAIEDHIKHCSMNTKNKEGKEPVKETITAYGLITRVFTYNDKYGYGCAECCNGDRCDEDCDAKYKGRRKDCPHCKGTGWIPKEAISPAPPSDPEEAAKKLYPYKAIGNGRVLVHPYEQSAFLAGAKWCGEELIALYRGLTLSSWVPSEQRQQYAHRLQQITRREKGGSEK